MHVCIIIIIVARIDFHVLERDVMPSNENQFQTQRHIFNQALQQNDKQPFQACAQHAALNCN